MKAAHWAQAVLMSAYVVLLPLPVASVTGRVRDELIGTAALIVATLVVLARGLTHPADRAWSWLFATGMAMYTAGNVVFLGYVRHLDPVPYPSVADIGFLGLYPPVALGLVVFVRRGAGRPQRSTLLDGLVTSLGAAAAAGAFAVAPLLSRPTRPAGGGPSAALVDAAYPVAAAAVVVLLLAGAALRGGRPGSYGWIAAGLTLFALADIASAYRAAGGTVAVGTPVDVLWTLGLNVVAFGVWRPHWSGRLDPARARAALAAPVLSVLLAVAVLVLASRHPTPLPVVLLAAATLLAATGRIVDGFLAGTDFARVRAEARTDELTGLGNRRLLYEAVDARIADLPTGQLLYLLLIDLDRFKEVNDSLGHAVGDEVLATVAARLAAGTAAGDVLVRLGGDEFALLLSRPSGDFDALILAQRLVCAVSQPIIVAGLSLQVGASVGIACAPVDSLDRTDLMRHADVAMYDSKTTRAGPMRYDPARDFNSRERLQLVGQLRDALATDPDQLLVYYQPKCRLDGSVSGAEALIRWQHPTRGLLPPDAFVPAAENNFLMPALTKHVLRVALKQCGRWRETAPRATVSVNLSVTSLLDESLVQDTVLALAQAGVPGDALVYEITETMIMLDPERSRRTLHALNAYGIRLSIDDYGTGHCSLAYIRDLPVRELKLDRSFVRDIAVKPRDAAIVRSTIELAHSLGLVLVAEGVEDEDGARLLRAMGCDLAQGFYFGRPVPAGRTIFTLGLVSPFGAPIDRSLEAQLNGSLDGGLNDRDEDGQLGIDARGGADRARHAARP
jgi:diguanylate cyclase (GGDEF)-like protein